MKSSELVDKLYRQVEILSAARTESANCKRAVAEMKDSLAMAEVNAISDAMGWEEDNALLTHKSPDVRNSHRDKILSRNKEVVQAKEDLSEAESRLIDAEMELEHQKDVWTAIRAEIRLMSAELEYLSDAPDGIEAF